MNNDISYSYKFNYPTRIIAVIVGLGASAFAAMIIKINIADKVYGGLM